MAANTRETVVFKTADTWEWRTLIPERWEKIRVRPGIIPSLPIERVSRLWCMRGACEASLNRCGAKSLGRRGQLEFQEQKRVTREGAPEGAPESPAEDWQEPVHEKKLPTNAKEPLERIRSGNSTEGKPAWRESVFNTETTQWSGRPWSACQSRFLCFL